jgi:transposase
VLVNKTRFLEQLLMLQEERRRRGTKRWPKEIQQRCAHMLMAGLVSGPELTQTMKVGIQTIYSWKTKYGRSGFKALRVVASSHSLGMDQYRQQLS